MKVTSWSDLFDLIHAGFTYAMLYTARVAQRGQITNAELQMEVRNLRRLCAKIWREGFTEENVGLVYVVLGYVPVTSDVYTKCGRLRDQLL